MIDTRFIGKTCGDCIYWRKVKLETFERVEDYPIYGKCKINLPKRRDGGGFVILAEWPITEEGESACARGQFSADQAKDEDAPVSND